MERGTPDPNRSDALASSSYASASRDA